MDFERSSGILLHPTSLPGKYGIGDLGQCAYDFIDFLYKGSQTLWQILPLNPTSFGDSPYQSFSTFAGNPLLISIDTLITEGYLKYEDLNDIPDFNRYTVDYGNVINFKNTILKKAFSNFKKNATKIQKNKFNEFCKCNKSWLDDYCLFISIKNYFINERSNTYLSDEYIVFQKENENILSQDSINDYFYGAVWNSWPKELISRTPSALSKFRKLLDMEIEFQKFLQYEFYREWNMLKQYANEKDIKIIGDIPIFVALDSADVWVNKTLFSLDDEGYPTSVAGVPPDYFSEDGQLWGNPLYAWDKHEKTSYQWWKGRIAFALECVDILRIDHFRGFESYWSIPYGDETAVNGVWKKGPGKNFFVEIKKSLGKLPIIAEDLGIITEKVEKLRNILGFPGMKVLQFGFDASNRNMNMPHNIKTSNVVLYTGTHDNDTTAGWYKNASPEIQDQLRRYMNVSGDDPAWDLIRLAFLSVAKFAIIPMQDIMRLGTENRMNTPGIASGNWQFRYTKEMLTDESAVGLKYLSDLSDRNILSYKETKGL